MRSFALIGARRSLGGSLNIDCGRYSRELSLPVILGLCFSNRTLERRCTKNMLGNDFRAALNNYIRAIIINCGLP
jgi:hypothetical protein